VGYTRVVKLGRRLGDGAELAVLELVDFNVGQEKAAAKAAKKSASRKKSASKTKKSADVTTASEVPEKHRKTHRRLMQGHLRSLRNNMENKKG
jgi:large subunit ribosomal protein L17